MRGLCSADSGSLFLFFTRRARIRQSPPCCSSSELEGTLIGTGAASLELEPLQEYRSALGSFGHGHEFKHLSGRRDPDELLAGQVCVSGITKSIVNIAQRGCGARRTARGTSNSEPNPLSLHPCRTSVQRYFIRQSLRRGSVLLRPSPFIFFPPVAHALGNLRHAPVYCVHQL